MQPLPAPQAAWHPTSKRPLLVWSACLLLLTVFVLLKLSVLRLPYFWDELNVYATGSLYMHDHGIGILPAQLDPEYSRGHPLLSYAYTALFYRLFGDSVAVGHASAILAAVLVLALLFWSARKIFGPVVALGSIALLMCQPVFFSMAGAIYPEMLLTLFTVWGIYALAQEKWGQFALAGALAVLVKEPGLALPAAGGVYWLLSLVRTRDFRKTATWLALAAVLTPVLVYGLFLVIQKAQNGWYFFPYHLEIVHFDASYVWANAKRLLTELFTEQGRIVLSAPLLISLFFFRKVFATPAQQRYFLAFFLVLAFTLAFAAVNFYLARYWLFVYPSFILLALWALWALAHRFVPRFGWLPALVVAGLAAALGIRHMDGKTFADNYDMAYVHTVEVVQESIDWLQTQPQILADTPRVTFPIFEALRDPRNGYVKRPIPHRLDWNAPSRYFLVYRLPGEPPSPEMKDWEIKRFERFGNSVYVLDTWRPRTQQ